jgi:hypothetical protein
LADITGALPPGLAEHFAVAAGLLPPEHPAAVKAAAVSVITHLSTEGLMRSP